MSKTTNIINRYYNLLEYDVSPEMQEYYGCTVDINDLKSRHDVVCIDSNCSAFKDTDQVNVDDIVYVEDEDGDLVSYKVTSK